MYTSCNSNNPRSRFAAFSLVELLIAISLFVLIFGSIAVVSVDSIRYSYNNRQRVNVAAALDDLRSSLVNLKNENWTTIEAVPTGSPHHIDVLDNSLSIQSGPLLIGDVQVYFEIHEVYRDPSGLIVDTNGTLDPYTLRVDLEATWTDILGDTVTETSYMYLNNWNIQRYTETTQSEFDDGTYLNTVSTMAAGDGEVQLATQIFGDWCNPQVTNTSYDLPGQGVAKTISAVPGQAVMGTGGNSSGLSFINVSISDDDPPDVVVEGTLDGYKTNDAATDGDFAYLATDSNSSEVVIVDIRSTPYTVVGSVDTPGSRDAESISIKGDYGYVTVRDKLYIFDIRSPFGSRPIVSDHNLYDRGTYIETQGDYAYILIAGAVEELEIVDISNPSSPQTVGWTDVNSGVRVSAVTIAENGQRLYIGAENSSSYDELFVVDISSKTGSRPIIGSYDTPGLNVRDIDIVEDGDYAILVGENGEEYQVLDLTDPSNVTRCGGLDLSIDLLGIAAVKFTDSGNAYAYVVSDNSNNEMIVIKGGIGGGDDVTGLGYLPNGTYTSGVFDTGSSDPLYFWLDWDETLPANSGLSFQVRSSDSSNMSGATSWVGPDGTPLSYFEAETGEYTPSVLNGNRYLQYRAFLETTDALVTPVFSEIRLLYEE